MCIKQQVILKDEGISCYFNFSPVQRRSFGLYLCSGRPTPVFALHGAGKASTEAAFQVGDTEDPVGSLAPPSEGGRFTIILLIVVLQVIQNSCAIVESSDGHREIHASFFDKTSK